MPLVSEPLPSEPGIEVTADFFCELNHRHSPIRVPSVKDNCSTLSQAYNFVSALQSAATSSASGLARLKLMPFPALLHQFGDDARPTGLVTGSNSSARVSVKVFVKEDQVAPGSGGLKLFQVSENRPSALFVSHEDAGQAARQFARHFPQSHHFSRPGRELNFEIPAQVVVELLPEIPPKGNSPETK